MMSLFCASSPANDGGEVGASAASLILSQVRRGGSVWRLDRRGETIITADWATEDGRGTWGGRAPLAHEYLNISTTLTIQEGALHYYIHHNKGAL